MKSFLFELEINLEHHNIFFECEEKIQKDVLLVCILSQFLNSEYEYLPSIYFLSDLGGFLSKNPFLKEESEILSSAFMDGKSKIFQYFIGGRDFLKFSVIPMRYPLTYEKRVSISISTEKMNCISKK